MESFGMKDGSQMKSTSTTFGLIRRGNASDMEKMKPHFFRVMLDFMLKDAKIYNFKHVNEFERLFNDVKVEEGIDVGKEKGHREGQKNVGTGRIAEFDGKLKQVKNKKGGAEEKRKGKLAFPVETPNHPMGTKMRGSNPRLNSM
ncbi:unnamed protein product [Linum tenue]|uniref:Uncharacterized protein n=1 Tax=Linum tenue TaxID=586396 RepID=A0AAV0L5F3_9ROSI|nr:unnamed protein product [Linum tenue]